MLAQAEVDLQEEMEGPDQLVLQGLQAAVEEAEAKLAQAEIDRQEEVTGPDQVDLAVRQKAVALAREKLTDLIDGPDAFEVGVKSAAVAAAEAEVADALKDLEGAAVRARFDGIVALVNVEIDDEVTDESRVLEIIDATVLEVDGLVDAIDTDFVQLGAKSNITIASVPGQEFQGTVISVADEPRTERGVVSYPVRVRVDLPEDVEVPARFERRYHGHYLRGRRRPSVKWLGLNIN